MYTNDYDFFFKVESKSPEGNKAESSWVVRDCVCETTYSKEYCGRSNDWECLLQGEVFELNCKEGKETFFFGLVVLIVKLFYLVLGKSQQSFFFFL